MEFLETIGFSPAQRNRISLEGFTSMKILVDHYQLEGASGLEKHLRDLNKTYAGAAQAIRVHYTPLIVSRFAGCLNYFIFSIYALHTIPDLLVIDIDVAAKHGKFWTKFKSNKASESSNDDDISTDLPKLKGATTWVVFRDAFSYKLRDMSNARGFSMAYIIDSTVRAVNHGNANLLEAADINLNEDSVFETRTIHFGDDFRTDNKVLWGMLEGALLNTDPFNLIAQYGKTKDDLKAWKALKAHYEGEDYIQVVREEAMSKLKNTHYKGETRNFKWENYVSSHIKAHKQLLDVGYNNGYGLDDATKIQFFRSNIVPQADMHVALSVARSYERKTFQDYVTFLTTEVNSIVSRKKQSYQPERRVSAYAKRGNNNNNGKRKGSSQLNLGTMLSETVEGKKIESRHYSKEDFGKLTRQQRNAVIRLNRDRRRKAWNNKNSNDEPGINAIEAISEDMKSIHTAVISAISGTNPTSNNPCNNTNKSENDSVVTFDEAGSAKSGRIGDYLANKRAKNIKSFTVVSINVEANDNTLVPSTYSNISSLSTEERYMGCKLGLDSHADVSCIGKHARVLEYLDGQSFTVKPFNDSYSPIKNVKMVNAALVAVDMIDGTTIILHLNQCLDFRSTMEDCILCTNQARINKVIVDDVPLSVHPTGDGTHSIYFPEKGLRFPLLLNGPVSYLPVRYPTDWDMNNCQHVDLTNCEGTWNPDDLKNPTPVHNVKNEFNVSGMMKLSERKSLTPDHLSQL